MFLTHFQMLSSMSISPSFMALKMESSVFVPMVSGTSFENWMSTLAIRVTRLES